VPEKSGIDAADCPIAVVAVMDEEVTALTAAGAIASAIIKPLNWRMVVSFCLVVRYCIGCSKLRSDRMVALFGIGR
jgi:hypothetical protein